MLRVMTVALVVIGVIAFLVLDAYVIARVMRSRAGADDYATLAVPGETAVTVPAGKLKLTYQESYKASSTEDSIDFGTPSALEVAVTSAAGEALQIKGPGFKGMGESLSTGSGWTRAVIGTVQVPSPGTVTVTAGPELPDAVEPQILIGK